jgi:hypothetical protein
MYVTEQTVAQPSPDLRHLPALQRLPLDGSWRTERSDFTHWLDRLVEYGSDLVQGRTRDGLQQFRLTPKGISLRQFRQPLADVECWAR